MSKLFLMAGTKGGIGKTLAATLLADAASDAGYRSVLFDCDEENESLFNAMSGRSVEQILERYNLEENTAGNSFPLDMVMDRIFQIENDKEHYPGENVFGIDMKAGSSYTTLEWMKLFPFELLHEFSMDVYIVGVTTSDLDSLMTFLPWLLEFESQYKAGLVKFLVIRNQVDGNDEVQYREILASYMEKKMPDALMLSLNNLNRMYMAAIRRARTSYGRVGREPVAIPNMGLMSIFRCQSEFSAIKKALAPLFPAIEANGGLE